MLYETKYKRLSCLILWKLDRLSRDTYDAYSIKDQLRRASAQIESVVELLPEGETTRKTMEAILIAVSENHILNYCKPVWRQPVSS